MYDQAGLGTALGVGFIICIFSLANAFGMSILDRRADKKNKENKGKGNIAKEDEPIIEKKREMKEHEKVASAKAR